MPIMIRWNKKADKIAYSLLGKPANMQDHKTAFQKKIDKQLVYQKTARSK